MGLAIVLGTVVVLLFHFVVVENAYAQEGELSTSTILRYNEGNITGGTITKIVDGDTLDLRIKDTIIRVRLSLVNTPERGEQGFKEATDFLKKYCSIGDNALLNVDNKQRQSYGRYVGLIYCEEGAKGEDSGDFGTYFVNLNDLLYKTGHAKFVLDFCEVSEFRLDDWAIEPCTTSSENIARSNSSSFNTLIQEINETADADNVIAAGMSNNHSSQRGEWKVDDQGNHWFDTENCSLVENSSGINRMSECMFAEYEAYKEMATDEASQIVLPDGTCIDKDTEIDEDADYAPAFNTS